MEREKVKGKNDQKNKILKKTKEKKKDKMND